MTYRFGDRVLNAEGDNAILLDSWVKNLHYKLSLNYNDYARLVKRRLWKYRNHHFQGGYHGKNRDYEKEKKKEVHNLHDFINLMVDVGLLGKEYRIRADSVEYRKRRYGHKTKNAVLALQKRINIQLRRTGKSMVLDATVREKRYFRALRVNKSRVFRWRGRVYKWENNRMVVRGEDGSLIAEVYERNGVISSRVYQIWEDGYFGVETRRGLRALLTRKVEVPKAVVVKTTPVRLSFNVFHPFIVYAERYMVVVGRPQIRERLNKDKNFTDMLAFLRALDPDESVRLARAMAEEGIDFVSMINRFNMGDEDAVEETWMKMQKLANKVGINVEEVKGRKPAKFDRFANWKTGEEISYDMTFFGEVLKIMDTDIETNVLSEIDSHDEKHKNIKDHWSVLRNKIRGKIMGSKDSLTNKVTSFIHKDLFLFVGGRAFSTTSYVRMGSNPSEVRNMLSMVFTHDEKLFEIAKQATGKEKMNDVIDELIDDVECDGGICYVDLKDTDPSVRYVLYAAILENKLFSINVLEKKPERRKLTKVN
ncbi:MAG: hypothetical protein ACTSVF_03635 [Candidatus Asgardarchaeia archaeon]